MSGITAVLGRGGAGEVVGELTRRLAHRGPDGSGVWEGDAVGLGHQHHCTLPESRGVSFPRRVAGVVVTADARLDNRGDLCETLDVDAGAPDVDLLAHAYRRWGVDYPSHLVGAFAAAVWDPERRRLVCARDHMGVRPVYYARTAGGTVAVASEPGPLVALDGVERTPDEHRVGDYLAGLFDDETATFYADVSRLPPGHVLTATGDGVDCEQYWSPAAVDPLPDAHESAYEARFRDLFEQAVSDRLRTHGTVGSLLSGGLDSSSIACVAAAERAAADEPPLRTFSAVFETVTACDERRYIDAVLDSGAFDPTFVDGDGFGPLVDLDEHLGYRTQPYYPSLFMLVWQLFRTAGDRGVDVILQGYGGDQTMGSDVRGHLRGLFRRGRLPSFVREFRGYLDVHPWLDARQSLRRDVLYPAAPQPVRRLRHRLFDGDDYLEGTLVPLDAAFARRSGLLDRIAAEERRQPPVSQPAIRRRSLVSGEPSFNLELNDIAGSAHGLEPRFPYFDKRLVEFVLGLPPGHTVSDGLDRTIVRRALSGTLPPAVRDRTDKAEFSPNVVHGLETYDFDVVEETLREGNRTVDRYLDGDALDRALDRFQSNSGVDDARILAMATTLERWLDRHAV